MDDQKKQLIARLKEAQNVLVTVSKNPSVDQLAAAIGLTLALNKLDKHATAVYSGETPSILEFLRPEDTLETNTNSLRDFIIALDKSKADKLRYKVEDEVVRIFITPYHTAISEDDLDFSQGDFNVDVVVALGVHEQQDLDEAILAHGRILHDATVVTVTTDGQSELGMVNIVDTAASSLSEVVSTVVDALAKDVLDEQIATALLTGIVAMTDRFGNDRTTPQTMSVSAKLMAAGANQQLVAEKLTSGPEQPEPATREDDHSAEQPEAAKETEPGTLEIHHNPDELHHKADEETRGEEEPQHDNPDRPLNDEPVEPVRAELPKEPVEDDGMGSEKVQEQVKVASDTPQIERPKEERLPEAAETMLPPVQTSWAEPAQANPAEALQEESYFAHERMVEPPSRNGILTANVEPEGLSAPVEALTQPAGNTPLLSHTPSPATDVPPANAAPKLDEQAAPYIPSPPSNPFAPSNMAIDDAVSQPGTQSQDTIIDTATQTLSEIEQAVDSPHTNGQAAMSTDEPSGVDNARNAVEAALQGAQSSTLPPEPIVALNAQPLGDPLHEPEAIMPPAPQFQPAPSLAPSSPLSEVVAPQGAPQPVNSFEASTLPPMPAPPSVFPGSLPGSAPAEDTSQPAPPPVPPPPIFPAA